MRDDIVDEPRMLEDTEVYSGEADIFGPVGFDKALSILEDQQPGELTGFSSDSERKILKVRYDG